MSQKIRDAFDSVKADAQMKEKVKQMLGDEAEIKSEHKAGRRVYQRPAFYRALAGVMILILVFVGGLNLYEVKAEAAYITMEGPVQICLSVNGKDEVIKAEGLNAEGETVISQVDVSGMHYQEALAAIMDTDSYQECQGEKAKAKVSCHDDAQAAAMQQTVDQTCHSYGQEYREHHGKNHGNTEQNGIWDEYTAGNAGHDTDHGTDRKSENESSDTAENGYGGRGQGNQNKHHAGHDHD